LAYVHALMNEESLGGGGDYDHFGVDVDWDG
jgi:hypothetical protein